MSWFEAWLLKGLSVLNQGDVVFANAKLLWLVWLWPIFWALSAWMRRRPNVRFVDDVQHWQASRALQVRHPLLGKWLAEDLTTSNTVPASQLDGLALAQNLVRGWVLCALVVALAGPQKIEPPEPQMHSKMVRDIQLVIESSASFLLPDYQLNQQPATRMEVVKSVLDGFVAQLPGNQFGLTLYAEQAYTLMPLSADLDAVRLNLQRLKPHLAGRTDEALGEALGLALKGVQSTSVVNAALNRAQNTALTRPGDGSASVDETVNASTTQPKQRLLVLISDGQSKISRLDLAEAVNYAQWLKVPIYTIGIGASHAVADTRAFTGLLYQPLESQSLKWLAAQTQGAYYQVGSGQDLQTVLQKIEQAAGTPLQTVPHTARTTELYYQPLQWVLLGLMLSVALSGWRVIRGDKG